MLGTFPKYLTYFGKVSNTILSSVYLFCLISTDTNIVHQGVKLSALNRYKYCPPGCYTAALNRYKYCPPGGYTAALNRYKYCPPGCYTAALNRYKYCPPGGVYCLL